MKSIGNRDAEWYRERIAYLSGFMLPEREQALRRTLEMRTRYVTICTENTFHPQNASALMRNCEAFGLQDIYAVEDLCRFSPHVRIVRGTDKWVNLHKYPTTTAALDVLRAEGYRIVATTPHHGSHTPESFDVASGRFALVFGTEHAGISDEVMDAADDFIKIPMCGFVESLNVSASAAIILYTLTSRLRASSAAWQLDESQQAEVLFRWMMESLRDSEKILCRFRP